MFRVSLRTILRAVQFLLMVSPTALLAQTADRDSVWAPMEFLVGSWVGNSEGGPGNGFYERTYRFVLSDKFMEVRNKSTYLPSKANPKGEVHEDWGMISFDSARRKFVLRQFHTEGFVNQYVLDSISNDGKSISFISETIENIPLGWRARESYHLTSNNEFTEVFELAPPDKEFEVYSRARLHRK